MTKNNKHIHIIGVCGVATSAIAIAFKDIGWKVTGSDKGFFPPVSTELEKNEIEFYAGWHPEKIGTPDMIMTGGSGTSPNNPEVLYAKEKNIPIYAYPEVLNKYFVKKNSIVCVGTWGKTTTSSLLSYILTSTGLNPSYMNGGLSLSHKTGVITDGDWSIFEGDEYQVSISDKRPKFVYYSPTHLLMTSLSWDHADLYPTEESYYRVFDELIKSLPENGLVIANKDRESVVKTVGEYPNVKYYGKENADYVYTNIEQSKSGLKFKIIHDNNEYNIISPLLGKFQAENITGCFAMAHQIGIPAEKIIDAIKNFKGLKRRFEKRHEGDITVIDDIAHSPEKARSILETLKDIYSGKIIAVFEPNIGGRQKEIAEKYNDAFRQADIVVIPRLTKLKISEDKSSDMEGNELASIISRTHPHTTYIEDDNELIRYIVENTKKNDVVAFLGSHGFRGMIEEVITFLRQQSQ